MNNLPLHEQIELYETPEEKNSRIEIEEIKIYYYYRLCINKN